MLATELAEALWPQLRQIAQARGLRRVRRVALIIGELHEVEAQALIQALIKLFGAGEFREAHVEVQVVGRGESFTAPGSDMPAQATGWEVFFARIEGEE